MSYFSSSRTDTRSPDAKLKITDVVGPQPTPISSTVDPAWLTWNDGTVLKLAMDLYERHRFVKTADRMLFLKSYNGMPILADALEEAGCTNEQVLTMLRTKITAMLSMQNCPICAVAKWLGVR